MPPARFWSISITILFLDQFTKWLAHNGFAVSSNAGVSFGLFANSNQMVVIAVIVILLSALFAARQLMQLHPTWMGLLVGGGASNLIDRIFFGGVRDFLPIPLLPLTNNLADWAIVIGVIGLLIMIFSQGRGEIS